MKFQLFSAENCTPCKSVYNYLINNFPTLKFELVYYHIRPDLFNQHMIKGTPTLVVNDEVKCMGYDNIVDYINNITYFDVTEEE